MTTTEIDPRTAPDSYARKCLANATAKGVASAHARHAAGCKSHPATSDADYTTEEDAYLAAVEAYKARSGRKFLLHTEHLMIFKALGYSKAGQATPAP